MSAIGTFFKDAETGAVKIVTFLVKQMTFAEEVLGAGTGSLKANLVITATEAVLSGLGVPVNTAETELKTVVDALTAFLTKAGILPPHTTPTTQ